MLALYDIEKLLLLLKESESDVRLTWCATEMSYIATEHI